MKKFVFLVFFTFFTMSVFGQIPNVVVSDFTSRARDVHEDDLVTVMEMFMTTLVAGKAVNVIDRAVLKREMTAIEFGAGDWSDSVKTTRLGEELNAIYIVSGTMTQLGTSITFDVIARDIKTLATIASDRKQYTTENVWDNSVGIPAQLSEMGNVISRGISTDYNKRQKEIQDQLARVEAEKRAQLEREQAEKRRIEEDRSMGERLIGNWWRGSRNSPPNAPDNSWIMHETDNRRYELTFYSNGTFSLRKEYWLEPNFDRGAGTRWTDSLRGTFTREGNNIRLSWSKNSEYVRFTGYDNRRGTFNNTSGGPYNSSGSGTITIRFEGERLNVSGNSEFNGSYLRE